MAGLMTWVSASIRLGFWEKYSNPSQLCLNMSGFQNLEIIEAGQRLGG